MHKHTCDAHAGRQASTEHEQDWEHHLLLRVRRAIQESGHTPESLFSQWDRDGDNSMTELELLQGLRCIQRVYAGFSVFAVSHGVFCQCVHVCVQGCMHCVYIYIYIYICIYVYMYIYIYICIYIYMYIYIYITRGTGSVGAGHRVSRR